MPLTHECKVESHNRLRYECGAWTFDKLYEFEFCPYCGDRLPAVEKYRVTTQEVYEVTYLVDAMSAEGAANRVEQGDVEPNDKDWVRFLDEWKTEKVEDE